MKSILSIKKWSGRTWYDGFINKCRALLLPISVKRFAFACTLVAQRTVSSHHTACFVTTQTKCESPAQRRWTINFYYKIFLFQNPNLFFSSFCFLKMSLKLELENYERTIAEGVAKLERSRMIRDKIKTEYGEGAD
jgi:hypothetical protein